MNPIQAVKTLTSLGYRFELAGDRLRYRYEGQGKPHPDTVRPLLEAVKVNKPDVMDYLIKLARPDHVLTCFDCEHFRPAVSPNPRQAWGHCEKRRRGRYGCATACEAILEARPGGHSG